LTAFLTLCHHLATNYGTGEHQGKNILKYAILASLMETNILNYRIIIEPDKRTGKGEPCFTAYCPTLGVANSGDTVEEATANIKKAIQVWIKSLVDDNQAVPVDQIEGTLVSYTSIKAPAKLRIAL